jgi:hypothetical protein
MSENKEDVVRGWRKQLVERAQKELELAQLYARDFNHGTSGHLSYTTMSVMAALLDTAYAEIEQLKRQLKGA